MVVAMAMTTSSMRLPTHKPMNESGVMNGVAASAGAGMAVAIGAGNAICVGGKGVGAAGNVGSAVGNAEGKIGMRVRVGSGVAVGVA